MILVAGFPYIRERYFATWRHVTEPDHFRFLLPDRWTAKRGKVVFHPPNDPRIIRTHALFPDSHAPIIGGLLKGWMPAFPVHLWRMRHQVHLVYACSEPMLLTTLWFVLFTKLFRKRLVLFSWENVSYQEKMKGISRFVHLAVIRLNLFLADGLICGNPEGERIHRHFTNKPIAVIPMNGVDPEQFTPDPQERAHSPFQGRFVYTFIGALGYRKGLDVLLKAFIRVRNTLPNAHLVLAGSGEYEDHLEKLLDTYALREHVTRFQWLTQHEIVRLLSVSDVFVYPSIPHEGWEEQFGYSMAEASLMKLPVISTRSGSIAEVVRDGETGFLVSPGNEQELADAMLKLAEHEDLRTRLGAAGRAFIIDRYSHAIVAQKFVTFFTTILWE